MDSASVESARPSESHGLAGFSVRRRVTVAMATITAVLFGLIALGDLKINLLPDLSYPTLTVRTEYTGAAPQEIETLVTEPLEEAVGVVKGLRKLKSVSRTGQSDVVLEFAWGTDMDQAGLEVRDKLETLNLPLEARAPVLLRFNPSTEPILRLVLTSSQGRTSDAELMRLRRYADEELKKRLEPVAGVAAVKVGGGLEDEVQVLIDQQRLAQLRLPLETVITRLGQENVNISAGRLEEGSRRYLVRTINQFESVQQMRDLLITGGAVGDGNAAAQEAALAASRVAALSPEAAAAAAAANAAAQGDGGAPAGGLPIRLRDIATVEQGYKERESIIRLGESEAVELAIYKEGDANTVTVADAVQAALQEAEKQLPEGTELTVIEDQAIFIRQALHQVRMDALVGGTLAVLMIFFFLRDGWSTFVISLSLPVSIIATFFFMGRLGLSLNVMSLGGLALATGLVVDDSIVVLESIAKARERGLDLIRAAVEGTREVSMAVVASTLTNVAVFLPLVFVEGVAGQLFRDQALTISVAILMSLAVSLTLIPMLSSLKARTPMRFPEEPLRAERPQPARMPMRAAAKVTGGIRYLFSSAVFLVGRAGLWIWRAVSRVVGGVLTRAGTVFMKPYDMAAKRYASSLPKALHRPVLVLGAGAIAFAVAMAAVPMLGFDLIPQLAQDRFELTLKLPPGTQLEDTDELVRAVSMQHEGEEGIHALYGVSGAGTRMDANPTESGDNIGKLSVVMAQGSPRGTEARLTGSLRETMAQYPGVEAKFNRPEIFSLAPPLEIELRGYDLDRLQQAGGELAALLQKNDRFVDVKSSVADGYPEIQIHFDQERAAALGMTTRQIADAVVKKVRGEVATRYSFRDRKIDVLVRAQETDRNSLQAIRQLIVNPEGARPVTLDAVASVVTAVGPSEIHHADQVRVAIISAGLAYGDLGSAVQAVQDLVAEHPLGADIGMHVGGQGEELHDSMVSLVFAFTLAIFLVYLVMASQFESLLHPFVILFTIPLALVGAVMALLLSGYSLSIVVFIGLILMVGIVVKNAILMVDKINQLREEGIAKYEAISRGAISRLRPIAMTTITALFGFLPLAIGGGEGSEVRAPMAITVIGGLAVSTLLTLYVIPVMYALLDRRPDEYYVERAKTIDQLEGPDGSTGLPA